MTARSAEITDVTQASNPKRCSFVENTFCCFIVWIFFTLIFVESLFQSCKHQCAVSLHGRCTTSLDRKAGSQLVRSKRSLSFNGWETLHPAGGKHFSFVATKQCGRNVCWGSPVNPYVFFLCKFGLRIFLVRWHFEEAIAGTGFHCSL